jgi:class 3 adenylate cyclase/tetratricopeptide (TPR) repeat protein
LANRGDVLIDTPTAQTLAETVAINAWRTSDDGERFAVVHHLAATPAPLAVHETFALEDDSLRPWVLPAVFEREHSGHGAFLTELRPTVALFLRFTGIEYDDDAQAEEKLNLFVSQAQAILARYEGALVQLTIGDKGSYLYASFGATLAHEDDARRAVQAALKLQRMTAELSFLQPVQIGVSSGTMRVGPYGGSTRRTYGALGDDTNLAARLMGAAVPGEIVVSGRVHKEIAEQFSFEPRPPLPLKGKAEPLPVFAVIGQRRQRAIRLEEHTYALPMMGRQAELALIDEKLALAAQGHGQVVGITADAGMGKSRLVAEVIRLARKQGFTGYSGACESSGVNTPYLVWKSIWQAFFDVDPTAPTRRQIRNLEGEIEDRAPLRVEAIPILSPLLDLPIEDNDFTRALEPKERRNVLTATLEECLKSAAAETPLLGVLEDLHWIDALSNELLETLARVSAALPVCFVLAYRPPESARLPAMQVESLPHFTQVTLDQLTASEIEQLIRAKLAQLFPARSDALPQALVAQLTARAEGNPFYTEEMLNYLRDRGINPYDEAIVDALELPASLHALILSRMDRLNETQKVALKAASIIGRLFSLTWLYGYYPAVGAVDRIKANLEQLAQLDLTPLDTPDPELAYLFKHIVTREVAYESLSYAMRAQLHEQLAQFIETQGADRFLDLLAFHYSQSDNQAKQREYLQKAGDAAQAAFANAAAIDYYTRCLPLLDDPGAAMALHLKRATVLELKGQWPEAEADYRAALALSGQIADAAAEARCYRLLGALNRLRGDYAAALPWLQQARDIFTRFDDSAGLALTMIETGIVWWRQGEYASARRETEAGLALAREVADKTATALALNSLAGIALNQGDYQAARALYEESLALRRATGDKWGISISLNNLGIVANRQGDVVATRALWAESLALNRALGDKQGVAASLNNLGLIVNAEGDANSARALHEESLALRRELGDRRGMAASLNNLGFVAHAQGDYLQAQAWYEEGLTLQQEMGAKPAIMTSLNNLGNLAVERGDAASAQASYRACLALASEVGEQVALVYSLAGLAAVMAQRAGLLRAARLAAAAETLRVGIGAAWEQIEARIFERTVAAARAGLDQTAFDAAWSEGTRMALDEAIAEALVG